MIFWEHFLRLLPHRPARALIALYWHLTRRKVRALNRLRVASADMPFTYQLWIKRRERNDEIAQRATSAMAEWKRHPRFCIIIHGEGPKQSEDDLTQFLENQLYPFWVVVDARGTSIVNAIPGTDVDFVVFLNAGSALSDAALFRFAECLQTQPDASILYGDEDRIDQAGRRSRPWFKPSWNEEMFFAQNYLAEGTAIEIGLARRVVGQAENFSEFMLLATLQSDGPIVHVPHIICHVPRRPSPDGRWLEAVGRHLQPLGAMCVPAQFGTIKVDWPIPEEPPLVSIIVPTKDKVELLTPCIESVLNDTVYKNFEILIIDNASTESKTFEFFKKVSGNPQVRIIPYPAPYNYSAINNFAVAEAKGNFVCLLNNDTEVLEPLWLTEMVRYAIRPEIGAVGAKLLYADRTIQHAGVVIGIGGAAGHSHRFLPDHEPGYFNQAHVTQYVSAVTAACLLVDKKKFLAVGGLDAAELQVAFNDVDLCLKLQHAGWRNLYVPHAVLLHHESKSRGNDLSSRNVERYKRELKVLQDRWGTGNYSDPYFSPNLDPSNEVFVVRL